MKIYTRKGDTGTTQLLGGKRIPKNDLQIEAYGTVDELNSFVGMLREHVQSDSIRAQLDSIQNTLFVVGSNLAADAENSSMKLPRITDHETLELEKQIDEMDKNLLPLKNFLLPGGSMSNSVCHVVRTVCRRAERCTVQLSFSSRVDEKILKYLNRLSDYFFVLSRELARQENVPERPWKGS